VIGSDKVYWQVADHPAKGIRKKSLQGRLSWEKKTFVCCHLSGGGRQNRAAVDCLPRAFQRVAVKRSADAAAFWGSIWSIMITRGSTTRCGFVGEGKN